MADNVTLPGTGTVVAADDVSSVWYQRVKLVDGTLDSTAAIAGDATNGLDVDVTRIVPGTGATNLGKAEDAAHSSGDTGVLVLGVRNSAHASRTDADGDYTAIAVDSEGCLFVVGNVAHDAADADGPVKIGARAVSADPAAVATDDRTNLIASLTGKLITLPYTIPENTLSGTASTTGSTDTAVIAAQGVGVRIYVTSIIAYNSSATNTYINIKEGSTTLMVMPLPAYGGVTMNLPLPLRLTANNALNYACPGAVTTSYCTAVGYKGV